MYEPVLIFSLNISDLPMDGEQWPSQPVWNSSHPSQEEGQSYNPSIGSPSNVEIERWPNEGQAGTSNSGKPAEMSNLLGSGTQVRAKRLAIARTLFGTDDINKPTPSLNDFLQKTGLIERIQTENHPMNYIISSLLSNPQPSRLKWVSLFKKWQTIVDEYEKERGLKRVLHFATLVSKTQAKQVEQGLRKVKVEEKGLRKGGSYLTAKGEHVAEMTNKQMEEATLDFAKAASGSRPYTDANQPPFQQSSSNFERGWHNEGQAGTSDSGWPRNPAQTSDLPTPVPAEMSDILNQPTPKRETYTDRARAKRLAIARTLFGTDDLNHPTPTLDHFLWETGLLERQQTQHQEPEVPENLEAMTKKQMQKAKKAEIRRQKSQAENNSMNKIISDLLNNNVVWVQMFEKWQAIEDEYEKERGLKRLIHFAIAVSKTMPKQKEEGLRNTFTGQWTAKGGNLAKMIQKQMKEATLDFAKVASKSAGQKNVEMSQCSLPFFRLTRDKCYFEAYHMVCMGVKKLLLMKRWDG